MKRIFYLFLLAIATTTSAFCGKRELPITIHNGGPQSQNLEEDRCPIRLPISVYMVKTIDSICQLVEIHNEWVDCYKKMNQQSSGVTII